MHNVKKLELFLLVFLMYGFFVGLDDKAFAASVTVGQDFSKSGNSAYFYYNPNGRNAQDAINSAINAAAQGASAGSHGVVTIENASSPYFVNSHILAKSNVDIVGAGSAGGVCGRRYRQSHGGDRTGAPAMHHPGSHHCKGHPCGLPVRGRP